MAEVATPPRQESSRDSTGPAPKLDELMLAMDVVDTLRHEEGLIEKELGQEQRDEALEVSDRVLEDGIRALKESRFVYTPPPSGFGRMMATLWVKRGVGVKFVAVALILWVVGMGWQVWNARVARQASERARVELAETLPHTLSTAADAARREAAVPAAREAVEKLFAGGQAALAAGDAAAARNAIAGLTTLRNQLVQQYTLRIVSRPGEQTGIFRIPDVNQSRRNYYLIVEAVAPDGKVLRVPIVNEENGKTEMVTKWGVRVPESTYDAVRQDKQDDGIVQNNRLGEKKRGALDPNYLMWVEGGNITKW
jgi:hypothetical protein